MPWHVSPWVYPLWDSLCLLDLINYFLFHVGEIFNYNLFINVLIPSSSSGTLLVWMLVCLIWSQRSLRLSSGLFILFPLFCCSEIISTILSSSSLICSSASDILLLIPSRVFLISVIVLSVYVYSVILPVFVNLFLHFLPLFSRFLIMFSIIILNSFSGSLPIYSSVIWTSVFLVCSFICIVFLCLFFFFLTYCVWGLLFPLQGWILSSFWLLPS